MATANASTYYWRSKLLRVLFHGADAIAPDGSNVPGWENVGGSYAPGAIGSWQVSLHTAAPAEGAGQNSNEVAGAWYARQSIARTAAAWSVDDVTDPANPFAENLTGLSWAKNTSGVPVVVTHVALGRDVAGVGLRAFALELRNASDVPTPVTVPPGASFAIGARGLRIFRL